MCRSLLRRWCFFSSPTANHVTPRHGGSQYHPQKSPALPVKRPAANSCVPQTRDAVAPGSSPFFLWCCMSWAHPLLAVARVFVGAHITHTLTVSMAVTDATAQENKSESASLLRTQARGSPRQRLRYYRRHPLGHQLRCPPCC